ncbi:MAG: SDR family NAD(P)-dependent oxidoreductase [Actinomycetes bacterium]
MKVDGQVAVVTGASSGIGAATCLELARHGATVVAVARRKDRLDEVVTSCRAHAADSVAHPADVGSREACEQVITAAVDRFGRVDILVNNAGISIHRAAERTPPEDVERLMAVNFFGPVYLTMAALPGMLERQRGAVVNITSVAGHVPNPGESAYGASKAALSRWSQGLTFDLHGTGVHVGALSPGPIDTEIWSLDEEVIFKGKMYPPSLIAAGVVRMIDREIVAMTVPRSYGAVGAMYPLFGRLMRWGMHRYEDRAKRSEDGVREQ